MFYLMNKDADEDLTTSKNLMLPILLPTFLVSYGLNSEPENIMELTIVLVSEKTCMGCGGGGVI